MPTPSHLPIVPGTLCWLRSNIPENDGALVTVVSYNGILCGGYESWEGAKVWIVTAKVPLVLAAVNNPTARRVTWVGEEVTVPEMLLVPIAGPGLKGHVEHFDANSQPETIGQLLRDAGLATKPVSARPTPNVRR